MGDGRRYLFEYLTDVAWMPLAACRGADPDLWFPTKGASTRRARAICRECPVLGECFEYGLSQDIGIWGSTSERQRRMIRVERFPSY